MYLEVWNDLSTDEDRLEVRKDVLEQPIPLREEQLPLYASDSTAAEGVAMLNGTIRADYTISTRGRVKNIRTEASPAEFTEMQRAVHREIRGRFFRPPMVDGAPVEAANQVYVHEFLYQQAELEALRQAANKAPGEKT